MTHQKSELRSESTRGVLTLTLNRPERRNALSQSLIAEIDAALAQVAGDRNTRVVIISSIGSVFCSGHDLGEIPGKSAEEYHEIFATCARMMLRIHEIPQPVIARVDGLATAAGCQLVAACDLAVATETARFAAPGVKIGLFCTTPMVPLVRNILPKFAMEMLLTGQPISAAQALAAGLVNRVVPVERLDATIQELADAICATSFETIRIGKRAFYEQLHLDERTAYAQAVDVMTQNIVHPDAQEGIAAFLQKRSPRWGTSSR